MDSSSVSGTTELLADFREASRCMQETFVPLFGHVPAEDLREELVGHLGRLRGLLDLYVAESG